MKDIPAFPQKIRRGQSVTCYFGMTLLDYFAGQCLVKYAAEHSPEKVAQYCYEEAEAMLTEKSKREGGEMKGLYITENLDRMTVTVKCPEMGIDAEIPLCEFASMSLNNVLSGKKITQSILEWQEKQKREGEDAG